MKKIININLSGRLVPIEDSAYELLKEYLDSLTRYFSREEGGDEIVSDIEDRIAELFQEKLKKGAHCITDEDVNSMIAIMGRPEQLEEETSTEPDEKHTREESYSSQQQDTSQPKRLLRNQNDQLIGGVCSGIANYFNIDPAIVRIITFLLIWAYGIGLLAYVILWIVIPGSNKVPTTLRRRLYRDPDHKVLGGVASGLAAYFKIDPIIPRIIFVLPLLSVIFVGILGNGFGFWGMHHVFFPLSVGALPSLWLLYIILWIVVPKAVTAAEKLEMRGEKVDLQSLSNAYKSTDGEDEKKKIDREATSTPVARSDDSRKYSGAGRAFGFLVRLFLYFILAIIVIVLAGVLIGLLGGFIGVATVSSLAFPVKSLLLSSGLQKVLIWPAIILTLGIPVIAIIWLFVKLITGIRSRSHIVGISLLSLWIIGLVCATGLAVSVARDFRMQASQRTEIHLIQPRGTLTLARQSDEEEWEGLKGNVTVNNWNSWNWNGWSDLIQTNNDTTRLGLIKIDVRSSPDSNYHFRMIRYANGSTTRQAAHFASLISYPVTQKDSVLYLPVGFKIFPGVPFRNQHILLKIYVPEGKNIDFRDGLERWRKNYFDDDRWEDRNDDWIDHKRAVYQGTVS